MGGGGKDGAGISVLAGFGAPQTSHVCALDSLCSVQSGQLHWEDTGDAANEHIHT